MFWTLFLDVSPLQMTIFKGLMPFSADGVNCKLITRENFEMNTAYND